MHIEGFDELFDINHQLFCWLYRASFCWFAVKDAVPSVRAQVRAMRIGQSSQNQAPSTDLTASNEDERVPDYILLFRLLFFLAASDLASMTQQPLEKIGTLFGGVLDTGTIRKSNRRYWFFNKPTARNLDNHGQLDEESQNNRIFGRGQALFLVRSVNTQEAKELKATGYRFAAPAKVVSALASNMEITKAEALKHFQQMQVYSEGEKALEPGVHLAAFFIRPEFQRGLGILVHQKARNVLPTTQLPITRLEPWHLEFLRRMDKLTLAECLARLHTEWDSFEEEERTFAAQLLNGMTELRNQLDHPMLTEALLHAHPLEAPSGTPGEASPSDAATIIVFRVMMDVFPVIPVKAGFQFQPWRFFACQQRVYSGYPHHRAFVQQMRRDLESVRWDATPMAKESFMEKARKLLTNRLHYPSLRRLHHAASQWKKEKRWTISSSSGLTHARDTRERTVPGNSDGRTVSTCSNEMPIGIEEMLRSGPSFQAQNNIDVAPLDPKTFADVLVTMLVRDRESNRTLSGLGMSS